MTAVISDEVKERFAAANLARADLYFFARWMFLRRRGFPWKRAAHHRTVCDALMRVFRGECTRLIINIPPRYSKTELAVVMFIAWCMGQVPDSEFIHVSYASPLAVANSAQVRAVLQHEAYGEIFPETRLDSDAKAHWTTSAGGVVYATGAGGTIPGFGAGKDRPGFGGAIIIDDPHKADEARSDTVRQSVIDWFQNTLESRQNAPGRTPAILIMQRLHEKDLAGWLLGGGNGEKWEHVNLPAMQADGTALWPEKHDVPALQRMERASPYVFAGQYQQRPAPAEGGIFKPDQMPIVEAIPAGVAEWCRGWDLGATEGAGDYTAGPKVGRLRDGRYIVADVQRAQLESHKRDTMIRNTADGDGIGVKQSLPQDPGQAGKSQAVALTSLLAGHAVRTSPESGDKIVRARPFASQVNAGNVLMLRAAWNHDFVEELRLFPNGLHDDQVDASSRAFNELLGPPVGVFA